MRVYEQRMRTASSCDNIHKLLTLSLNYNRANAGGTANCTTDSDCRSEATYATPGSVLSFRVQQPYNTDTLSSTDTMRSNPGSSVHEPPPSLWSGAGAPPTPAFQAQSAGQPMQTAGSTATAVPVTLSAHLLRTPKVQRRVCAPKPMLPLPLPQSQCSSTCSTLTRTNPPPPPSQPQVALDSVTRQLGSMMMTSWTAVSASESELEAEAETSGSEALSDPASIEVAAARRHAHDLFAKAQRLTEQSAQYESARRHQEALLACSQGRRTSMNVHTSTSSYTWRGSILLYSSLVYCCFPFSASASASASGSLLLLHCIPFHISCSFSSFWHGAPAQ